LECESLDDMLGIAVNSSGSIPPACSLTGRVDNQSIAFPLADRIALIKVDIRGNVLAIVEIDRAGRAGRIPSEDNSVLVLHGLKSHLDSKICRYAGRQAMRIGFVEHVVLGLIGGL